MKYKDKVYCKNKYWEFVDKDNKVNEFCDKCTDLFDDYTDWTDSWLKTDKIRNIEKKKRKLKHWLVLGVELILVIPVVVPIIILLSLLFLFAYEKKIFFEKGVWYEITDIHKDGTYSIKGDKNRISYFWTKKEKSDSGHKFKKYFATSKELRKIKLKKLHKVWK